jgi:hypothetical protein
MTFQEMLEANELNTRFYSGRAMFGAECLAVTGDKLELADAFESMAIQLLDAVLERHSDETDRNTTDINDLRDMMSNLFNYEQDSMGMGSVYYWPAIDFEKPESNDDPTDIDDPAPI